MEVAIEHAHETYAKEPVSVVEKAGAIAVGDKVRINGFYLGQYCGVQSLIGMEAEVVKITSRPISASKLSDDKSDYQRFITRYGKKDTYDIIGLQVRYPNDARLYMVSPFGYDKIGA
jgi:hypothetical protein